MPQRCPPSRLRRVRAQIRIAAPAADVFGVAQSHALRLRWDPFLRTMTFPDGESEPAPGVRAAVRARNGLSMTVRYTKLQPPAVAAMEMLQGPRFFAHFSGTWLFRPVRSGDAASPATDVTFHYQFATRPALLRPLVDPVITAVFRRDIRRRLAGLRQGVELLQLAAELSPREKGRV